jgi:2-aminoethylphosphonate-pyruvate transaminase
MLRDLGSRDDEFIQMVAEIRAELLQVAGVSRDEGYECVLMQGSGTFGIESVMTCAVPRGGKWLIAINGAYGHRMHKIAQVHDIDVATLEFNERSTLVADDIDRALGDDPQIDAVAVVHCETTTGVMNPIKEIGKVVRRHGKTYFVDSMSAFGAVPFDFQACEIDYLVSSANKCIEGVPGFSFCIARRSSLESTEGWSRTLSLNLYEQWCGLERNGQFRFTPPTHTMLAFRQALHELSQEGGVEGRSARYQQNYRRLCEGMRRLGFEEYLDEEVQGYIITSFVYPEHENFVFESFYERLNVLGFVIYPGKVSDASCFRIGNIGRLFESDVNALLIAVEHVIQEMGVELGRPAPSS